MTTHRTLRLLATAAALALLAGCGAKEDKTPPAISFAPYGEAHNAKPDFAELEAQHPLSVEELYKITPKNLALLEDLHGVILQQDPEAVDAERGTERDVEKVECAHDKRENARGGSHGTEAEAVHERIQG